MKARILLLASLLLLSSCAGPVKLYKGKTLSQAEIATLRSCGVVCDENNKNCSAPVIAAVDSVDFLLEFSPGRNKMITKGTPIEILPGWHTALVYWETHPNEGFVPLFAPTRTVTFAFEAKAGHEYVVEGETTESGTLWSAWITDASTGEQVSRLVPRTSFTDSDTADSLVVEDQHIDALVEHVSLRLQQSTIDSIARTPFITEQYSAVEHYVKQHTSGQWHPTFLKGQQTYFSFYPERELAEGHRESAALVLTTGRLGQMRIAEANAALLHKPGVQVGLRRRKVDNKTIPWYHYLQVNSPGESDFYPWALEYAEQFLQYAGVVLDSTKQYSRHAFMTSKRPLATDVPTGSTMFNDIVEIELELERVAFVDLQQLAATLDIGAGAAESWTTYQIGDCLVKADINPEARFPVRKVVCSLTEPADSAFAITFGPDARLQVADTLATWYFGPPSLSAKE